MAKASVDPTNAVAVLILGVILGLVAANNAKLSRIEERLEDSARTTPAAMERHEPHQQE